MPHHPTNTFFLVFRFLPSHPAAASSLSFLSTPQHTLYHSTFTFTHSIYLPRKSPSTPHLLPTTARPLPSNRSDPNSQTLLSWLAVQAPVVCKWKISESNLDINASVEKEREKKSRGNTQHRSHCSPIWCWCNCIGGYSWVGSYSAFVLSLPELLQAFSSIIVSCYSGNLSQTMKFYNKPFHRYRVVCSLHIRTNKPKSIPRV